MTEQELLEAIDPVLLRQGDPNASEATSPLWVYCAGPMRGIAEFNFPAFEEATTQLRSRGYKVISPAEQDLGRGFDPTGLTGHEDLSVIGFDLREALLSDLKFVSECDAICLLPGWEFSKGASAELALAEALGLSNGTLDYYLRLAEPMSEHEFLQGEKERDARLDRLDHFLTSSSELRDLREYYGNFAPAEIEKAVSLCSNCDGRKCMSCVFREIHDDCRDDCPVCCNVDDLPAIIFPAEVRITSSTGGAKGSKPARFDLIPTRPWWAVAELFGYGTRKYEDRNWERGYDWSLSYAALQRHANLFWSREDDDPETGLPHLAAVVFHALALMEYARTHPEFDDRPEGSK